MPNKNGEAVLKCMPNKRMVMKSHSCWDRWTTDAARDDTPCVENQAITLCRDGKFRTAAAYGKGDRECIAMLCDQRSKDKCCKIRTGLLDHGVATLDDFTCNS